VDIFPAVASRTSTAKKQTDMANCFGFDDEDDDDDDD
jgi:hypothetical protein